MRFEPAGMTDDPDIRFATRLIDYLFRRLAVDYLSLEERAELSILTIAERMQPTLPGVEETVDRERARADMPSDPPSIESAVAAGRPSSTRRPPAVATQAAAHRGADHRTATPRCACSAASRCSGPARCHACPSCGTTSGCS